MKVVDVHTHMLNQGFLKLLRKHGGNYRVKKVVGGQTGIFKDGAPFMTLMPGMFDYDLRIQAMDAAGVDIAIVTLTSPNVYWGSARSSLEAAKLVNDDMAARQKQYRGAHPLHVLAALAAPEAGHRRAQARVRRAWRGGRDGPGEHRRRFAHGPEILLRSGKRSTSAACRCSCIPPRRRAPPSST